MPSKHRVDDLTSRRWQLFPGAIIGVSLATLLVGIWLAFGGIGGAPTPLARRGGWPAAAWGWSPSSWSSSSSHFSSSLASSPLWSLVFILVFFVFFFAPPRFPWGRSAVGVAPGDGVGHGELQGRSTGCAETALRRGRHHRAAVRADDGRDPSIDTGDAPTEAGRSASSDVSFSGSRVTLEVTAKISSWTSNGRL